MKEQDLRIGNWFYVDKSNCLFSKGYHKVTLDTYEKIRYNYALDCMEEVELTEEILLKCGFKLTAKNIKDDDFYSLKDFEIVRYDENSWCIPYLEFSNRCFSNLHQLQNLYFALTGEELNIEL